MDEGGFVKKIIQNLKTWIIHEFFFSFDWIILLYGINMLLLLFDLILYAHYNRRIRPART